jgi:hypothetical protein
MADDDSPKSEPEIVAPAPAAPPPRSEPRYDPGVIEAEATEMHEAAPEPAAEPAVAEPVEEAAPEEPPPPEPPARSGGSGRPLLAGALGALIGAAIALAAAVWLDPRAAALDAANLRMTALDRSAAADAAAIAGFDKRLQTNEAGTAKSAGLDALDKRVAKLENAAGAGDPESALGQARAARDDAAKALATAQKALDLASAGTASTAPPAAPDTGPLAARIDKLEGEVAGLKPVSVDLSPLESRLATVEGALAAPKSEARVPATVAGPGGDGAAAAILAISLEQRLNAGAPFAPELAGLAQVGGDAAKLTALKPYADAGAPTIAALGVSFAKVAPAIAAAAAPAAPAASAGVMDRLVDNMRNLVRVHKVGETVGDDPGALAPRIAAALARGDLAAALEAYQRLPEAARQAGGDWLKVAQARLDAAAAAQALRAEAVDRLAAANH